MVSSGMTRTAQRNLQEAFEENDIVVVSGEVLWGPEIIQQILLLDSATLVLSFTDGCQTRQAYPGWYGWEQACVRSARASCCCSDRL